jgi:hypothetical protein
MTKTLPLTIGSNYVFIDTIYIDNFKKAEHDLLISTSLFDLRAVLFPYAGDPYAIFKADRSEFDLSRIRYIYDDEGESCEINQFCSDSGAILVVDEQSFLSVVRDFEDDAFYHHMMNPSIPNQWTILLDNYENKLFWFYTSEIKDEFGGGGNFEIN